MSLHTSRSTCWPLDHLGFGARNNNGEVDSFRDGGQGQGHGRGRARPSTDISHIS